MQRQRGELVPIGEALADLSGPVQALRDASPQALHHFTQADQVNQLVSASEADPDLGFMARMLVLCSLPRTNPGDRIRYKRVNGPYTLYPEKFLSPFKIARYAATRGGTSTPSSWIPPTGAARLCRSVSIRELWGRPRLIVTP